MANKRNRRRGGNNSKPREQEQRQPDTSASNASTLLSSAANVYFSNIVGSNISRTGKQVSLPGVITFDTFPNYNTRSDMINTAATSIYTYVRHANSGRANYESSDLMLYLIQMAELFGNFTSALRVYGLYNYFTTRNLYSGRIIEALGYDAEDIRENAADYRWRFNAIINKMKSFAVPKTFHFFDELIDEYRTVYLDEDDSKAQIYAVRPRVIGEFDPYGEETGGSIKFRKLWNRPGGIPLSEYLDTIEEILDAIRVNEDMNIMSGDILKAYGDNLFSLNYVDVDFEIRPEYNITKLIQFQNAHVVHTASVPKILQENNKLSQTPLIIGDDFQSQDLVVNELYSGKRYINSYIDDVDPNFVFLLSKYQIVTEQVEDTIQIKSGNVVILANPRVFYLNGNTLEVSGFNQFLSTPAELYAKIHNYANVTKFAFHPYLYVLGDGSGKHDLPIGDMHNVALISAEDTERMNDTRFILIFQTPQMG